MAPRKCLSSRPLDLLYFIFFLLHIPATLLLDAQAVIPSWIVPTPLKGLPRLYFDSSADPLMGGPLGFIPGHEHLWFMPFLYVETYFQLPVFFIGASKLWKGTTDVYPLLLAYGASTTVTLLPCIAVLLATPLTSPETIATGIHSVTDSQRFSLLASYLPFFFIPLLLTIDMSLRLSKLLARSEVVKDKTT